MRLDKKATAGELRFVLLDGEGSASVPLRSLNLVAEVIDANR
jgi:hypothetical protein